MHHVIVIIHSETDEACVLCPISSGRLTYEEMQLPPGPFRHPVHVNAG